MPWQGDGTFLRTDGVYTGSQIWKNNRDAGTKITVTPHDAQDNDLADGLENCLTLDGQNSPSANIPMGTHKFTGIGDGSATTDSVSLKQVRDGSFLWCGVSGGSANAHTLTPTPAVGALVAGQIFRFVAGFTNTAAMTVDISGLGAAAVRVGDGSYEVPARLVFAGNLYELVFTGTYLLLRPAISQYLINETGINWGLNAAGHLLPSAANTYSLGAAGSELTSVSVTNSILGKDSLTLYAQTANALVRGTTSVDFQVGATGSWTINSSHHLLPQDNGSQDLGTSSKLIRDIYYNDSIKAANRTWVPTVTGIDSTVTTLTVSEADYARIGQWIHYNYYVFFNITVTPETTGFYVSLPVAGPAQTIHGQVRVVTVGGIGRNDQYSIDATNTRMLVSPLSGTSASYGTGSGFVIGCEGKYRAV